MKNKRISILDVAKAAGVSRTVVSRVINNTGYVSKEKRKAIERVIRELDYRPSTLARSLANNRSRTIGLCLPFLNSPFIADLMEGVEAEAEKYGYDIFICHTKEDPKVERQAIVRMIDRRVDGMVVAPVIGGDAVKDCMQHVPTILFLRHPPGADKNLILADDYEAARISFDYLLKNGHRRIGIIKGPAGVSTIDERWRAMVDLMRENSLELNSSLIVSTQLDFQESYEAAKKLLSCKNRPTAIYAGHYWAAAALLSAISDLGLSVPEDVSAVAYESFRDWTMINTRKFATNIFPAIEMGRSAIRELHALISGGELFMEKNIVIRPQFFPHSSVKNLHGAVD